MSKNSFESVPVGVEPKQSEQKRVPEEQGPAEPEVVAPKAEESLVVDTESKEGDLADIEHSPVESIEFTEGEPVLWRREANSKPEAGWKIERVGDPSRGLVEIGKMKRGPFGREVYVREIVPIHSIEQIQLEDVLLQEGDSVTYEGNTDWKVWGVEKGKIVRDSKHSK